VSDSLINDIHNPSIQVNSENLASNPAFLESPGQFRDQLRAKLDLNILENHGDQDIYDFDWIVKPAKDSGYSSGIVQESDLSFSEAPSTYFLEYPLHPEDKWKAVMFTTGNSDEVRLDCEVFLNFEEENGGNSLNDP